MSDTPPAVGLIKADAGDVAEPADDDARDLTLEKATHGGETSARTIADVERELSQAAAERADLISQLETQYAQWVTLAEQLRANCEQTVASFEERAARQRDQTIAESEALREAYRAEAERESTRIIEHASARAEELLAEAERKGAAIVDARREELATTEAEATERIRELETIEENLAHRVEVARRIYDELEETLKLIAETSIRELADARASLANLHPRPAEGE